MRVWCIGAAVAACLSQVSVPPTQPSGGNQAVTSEIVIGSLNTSHNPMVLMTVEQYIGGQWTPIKLDGLSPGQLKRKVLPTNQRLVIYFNHLDPPPQPPTP